MPSLSCPWSGLEQPHPSAITKANDRVDPPKRTDAAMGGRIPADRTDAKFRGSSRMSRAGSAGARPILAVGAHSMSHGKHRKVNPVRDFQLVVHPAEVVLNSLGLQAQA